MTCDLSDHTRPTSRRELDQLVDAGVIDATTAQRIAAHLARAGADRPGFDLSHTAYYLGAIVVMSALGWFMGEAWARYDGWVPTLVATSYFRVPTKVPTGADSHEHRFRNAKWRASLRLAPKGRVRGLKEVGNDPGVG